MKRTISQFDLPHLRPQQRVHRMSRIDSEILTIFRVQNGVISAPQALAAEMSRRQIQYRVKHGVWNELRAGVYLNALFDESDEMWMRALSLDDSGFISHRFGGSKHRLEPYDKAKPEMSIRRGRFPSVECPILLHETSQHHLADVVMIDGLPVSSVERTIMDIAAVERRQWAVLAAMDSAVLKEKATLESLNDCLKRHAKRGRNGTVRFRSALERFALPGARPIGHASRRAAALIRPNGLDYPTFEDRVYVNGEFVAQADLGWPIPLLVFLDGFTHHASKRAQTSKDRKQRQILRSAGLVVLEFTNDQLSNPGYIISTTRTGAAEARRRLAASPGRYRLWATERHLIL